MRRRTLIFFFIILLNLLGGHYCFAQTKEIEKQKSRVKQLEQDINFLDRQIVSINKEHKSTLDELVLIRKKVDQRKKLINELENSINNQTYQISRKEETIRSLERRLDTLEYYYRHMIYNAYKNRDTKLWFMYILASSNIEQSYLRWSYLKNYSRSINDQATKIKLTKEDLKQEKDNLIKLKENNVSAKASREVEFKNLSKEEMQSRVYAKALDKKQKEYKNQIAQKRKEASMLAKEVEKLIAEAIKKEQLLKEQSQKRLAQDNKSGKTPAQTPTTNQSEKLSGSFAQNMGKLPWPVSTGVIIEQFGEHPHPTLKNVMMPFNNGVNISTTASNTVNCVFDGVVKQVIAVPGYNQCILVQHGTFFTFYCKLSSVSVKVGDNVKMGSSLGVLENDNNTSVLHFELWKGTSKQNPELWLKKR